MTAGNASGQNDAASMCVVTTPEKADELGLTPLVRLVSWGSAGVAPEHHGHRSGARDRGRARQGRPAAERHRPHRAQRGVRRAGAGGDAGVEFHRRRPRPHQRARVGDLARPPGRRHRRPDARHAGARAEPARGALRAGDHVHRRRARASPRCSKELAHDQTRPDARPDRVPDRDRLHRTAIRRQGDHSERARNSSTPTPTRRTSSTRCARWACSG